MCNKTCSVAIVLKRGTPVDCRLKVEYIWYKDDETPYFAPLSLFLRYTPCLISDMQGSGLKWAFYYYSEGFCNNCVWITQPTKLFCGDDIQHHPYQWIPIETIRIILRGITKTAVCARRRPLGSFVPFFVIHCFSTDSLISIQCKHQICAWCLQDIFPRGRGGNLPWLILLSWSSVRQLLLLYA